ncbi:hypothetical protein V1525DRAFT_28132 [Lipomyces kononenkoae]|uniref:Uncharacterized protein n=1 Tax=Lipomyces kononenkoae TaxID=34357 RepID=A0ACC3T6J6_LIPKO
MVLFKRKVVHALPPPNIDDLNPSQDVWYIKKTGEYFVDYEEYLKRMDFYSQRRFICEISGHSNLSFFEALESETNEAREVDEAFPESLKEPVLRRVQFSTTSRLDHLVDEIYEIFKNDYYPGEYVYATITSEKFEVLIREKAQFNAIHLPNGEVRPAFAKYRVEIVAGDRIGQEEFVDQTQITRDRKRFSKSMLRTFMKNAISREPWSGAPWLVKTKYAHRYRIDTNVPLHLQKNGGLSDAEVAAEQARKLKEKKRLAQQAERERLQIKEQVRKDKDELREKDKKEREIIKRPHSTEDLDLITLFDPPFTRPKLKIETSFPQEQIGILLETFMFLNMLHETLVLSPFTFDDYIGCLQYSSTEQPCELFVEIHCAILKLIVSKDTGELMIELPPMPKTGSEPARPDSNVKDEDTANVDLKPKSEETDGEASPEPANRLKEMQKWREGDWKVRLQRRMFLNGGMELIILSILGTVSYCERWSDLCREVIDFVAPPDLPATLETARMRYTQLPKVLKLRILALLIELVNDGVAIRELIEYCMEESTRLRRERLETHKEHKALQDQIRAMEEEKEAYLPPKDERETDEEITEKPNKSRSRSSPSREEVEASLLKGNVKFRKLVENLENAQAAVHKCVSTLKQAEIDLRVLDIQRTRPLGRDRFYNRYWWFESNGFPTGLGPHGYLMGRLWVQGPSEEDQEIFVKNGRAMYDEMSLYERKSKEVDADGQINGTNEWGYYDDPADVKELYYWLGSKGQREPRLRKDLDARRPRIEAPMVARRKHLGLDRQTDKDKEKLPQPDSRDGSAYGDDDEPLRRSTRQREKIASQEESEHMQKDFRFLSWRNRAAMQQLGRTHYESSYKKTGDVNHSASINFATPASAAMYVSTSGKPSPQPIGTSRTSTPVPEHKEIKEQKEKPSLKRSANTASLKEPVGNAKKQASRPQPSTPVYETRSTRSSAVTKDGTGPVATSEVSSGRRSTRRSAATATVPAPIDATVTVANSPTPLAATDGVRRSSRQTRTSARFE